MPSSHLILCCPLLLLPQIPPSIRVFSNESTLCMKWLKYWSFSLSISPSNEHPGLVSFRMDWLDLLAVQGTLKSLLQHHSSKASILRCSAFFTVQLSHPYMTTGKTIALTRRTFVGKVISNHTYYLEKCIVKWSIAKSFPTLYVSMDCSLPGSSVYGILQARMLEWVAISFSRGSSWPRDWTLISCISCIGRWMLYHQCHLLSTYFFSASIFNPLFELTQRIEFSNLTHVNQKYCLLLILKVFGRLRQSREKSGMWRATSGSFFSSIIHVFSGHSRCGFSVRLSPQTGGEF